jgi:hypothetical protein
VCCANNLHKAWRPKWGIIKNGVPKFCGVYVAMVALNESNTHVKDTIEK